MSTASDNVSVASNSSSANYEVPTTPINEMEQKPVINLDLSYFKERSLLDLSSLAVLGLDILFAVVTLSTPFIGPVDPESSMYYGGPTSATGLVATALIFMIFLFSVSLTKYTMNNGKSGQVAIISNASLAFIAAIFQIIATSLVISKVHDVTDNNISYGAGFGMNIVCFLLSIAVFAMEVFKMITKLQSAKTETELPK